MHVSNSWKPVLKDNRDNIDFGKEPVGKLFRKMFLPTLVAMVSMVVLNITDGAFVGHGVGSDALAAVNIIAPLFMVMGGIGLMFGIGGSVVASIHLSKGKTKAANINITQSMIAGFVIGALLTVLMLTHQRETCRLFGSSEALMPLANSYLVWIVGLMPFCILANVGMFMVRLDGAPRLAMWLNLIAAGMNIFGDWFLIFPMNMGLEGAAIATSCSFGLEGVVVLIYLLFFSKTIRMYRLKVSVKSLMLSLRNIGYQIRVGGSAFLGEIAISAIIIIGNYQFMRYLGEDGVAAFSVGCYMTPICFMFGNAIVQSSQPIISFAHGQGNHHRIVSAMRIDIITAVLCGIGGMVFVWLASEWVSSTFLPNGCKAWELCNHGLPIFGISFLFVIINLTLIGYYQSTEKSTLATVFTFLRGVFFMLPSFILMPIWLGTDGLWLSQCVSEIATLMCISGFLLIRK